MNTFGARKRWRHFVRETLNRWGKTIEVVELGSTVNRKRWAGYDVEGLLSAWCIGVAEVRSQSVKLAGPNVTDFEPIYNAAMFAWFRQNNCLPDIHTDNLFVERIIQPEFYDRRVAGRFLARLLRFNLIKKARLLQKIGEVNGVPELWCSHVSWTSPRINRFIDNTQQKQADYLSRYYVLAAASGALTRVYWGAMVCERAGLLNDNTGTYPDHERVTLYDISYGTAAESTIYPAFYSLQYINKVLAGATYRGSLSDNLNLQIHAFEHNDSFFHVLWTINTAVANLRELYDEQDLIAAKWYSRDGDLLDEMPEFVSEAPLFLVWPVSRKLILKSNRLIPDLAVHWHVDGKNHYFRKNERYQGVLLARNLEECELMLEAIEPSKLIRDHSHETLRDARNAIWKIPDPRPERHGSFLVVKKPVRLSAYKKLYQRFRPSKARQSWNGASELLRRGVATAMPVAFFESFQDDPVLANYYICEYTDGAVSARQFLMAYAAGERNYRDIQREVFFTQLSQFVVHMHSRGIFFRDLSSGNILVVDSDPDRLQFSLIDTARARFFGHATSLYHCLSDLNRLCYKLDWAGRIQLMRYYMSASGREPKKIHLLPLMMYDLKIYLKRLLKRKRRRAAGSGG